MATKDYASPAQARLMRAVAHGWKPKKARGKLPSRAVANEFVDVKDRGKPKKRMYEGGLAPMNRVEEGKGGLGGLGATVQAFRKGGLTKAERRARREAEGYTDKAKYKKNLRYGPHKTRYKGIGAPLPRLVHGLGRSSRKHKGWMATNPQPRTGQERKLRRRAKRWQSENKWGDEILTKVKSPTKRRNLIRAGWVPVRDPGRKRKGKSEKKYKYGLDEKTVFYPPGQVSTGPSAGGLERVIQRRDPMSYIAPGGAEGGLVQEPVNMFYGGALRRALKELEEKKKREADPDYEPWMAYGTEPVKYADLSSKGMKRLFQAMRMKELGWQPSFLPAAGKDGKYTKEELKELMWLPPGQVGGDRGGDYEPPPPRDIPGAAVPPGRTDDGGLVPPLTGVPPDYVPPDRRAGRDTEYSRALREHKARVASSLAVPPGGYAGGGAVRGYALKRFQEGGTARADNPYDPVTQKYQWRRWERKHGRDPDVAEAPPPPPAEEPEPEELSWLDRLRGYSSRESAEDIDKKVEEMQARGGRVGYQMGGEVEPMMQELRGRMSPPMGGVPPRVEMQTGGVPMRAMPPVTPRRAQRYGPAGKPSPPPGYGSPQYIADQERQRLARQATGGPGGPGTAIGGPMAGMRMPGRGMPSRAMPPVTPTRMPQKSTPLRLPPGMRKPAGYDPRGGPITPPPGKEIGMTGGPMIPPNFRGMMQRNRMMNRPRRGIPGPAGAGGAPNRVGQSDQQGGLSRALQRGTGRPPMSRRQGFYR